MKSEPRQEFVWLLEAVHVDGSLSARPRYVDKVASGLTDDAWSAAWFQLDQRDEAMQIAARVVLKAGVELRFIEHGFVYR